MKSGVQLRSAVFGGRFSSRLADVLDRTVSGGQGVLSLRHRPYRRALAIASNPLFRPALKHLALMVVWVVSIGLLLAVRTAGRFGADPSDDFSFVLAQAPDKGAYRLMPERRVTEILEDHMELLPKAEAPKLAKHLLQLCRQYRFDPAFVLSLIQVESAFNIKAVSPYGAIGLMQVMPATALVTAREMGIDVQKSRHFKKSKQTALQAATQLLMDPYTNITFGIAYLSLLRDKYKGRSPYVMVAAYNVGPARMDELLSKKNFRPVTTKKYYESIRRRVPGFRFYRREGDSAV